MASENRRTFRLSDEDMDKLAAIAEHYFGKSDKMQTASLKMIIEKEYKNIKESSK